MRTILIILFLIIYYILSLPLYIVAWILGLKDKDREHDFAQAWVVNSGFRVLIWLSGVKVTVRGKENIPEGAAMYAFNHRSFYDIIVGYFTAPKRSLFVAKDSLAHVPLISRWMRDMHCLFLNRGDLRQGMQVIKQGIELLKTGHNVFIAPEGTRSKTDKMLKFHEATFKLADKSGCPIVPVALNNTAEIFEKHLPWVHSGHVIIEYMKPVYMNEMDRDHKKHVGSMVHDMIEKKVEENKSLV